MNAMKLKKLEDMKNKVGAMTSDEALELAIHFEQMARDVGPFDSAFSHFVSNYTGFMAYAELLCDNGE